MKQPTQWWQNNVVYQIYPRSFQDTNGDGIGDLPGILQRLDYLQWLGIEAVWISPIYESPMEDFGYDVSNYTEIDPLFGNLEDFDQLIHEAHRRNIKIILDYVPNHTSHKHPWFLESKSSRTSPKRDWYIWRDGKEGGPPNNWRSVTNTTVAGSIWEFDEASGQYYLCNFSPIQPDLNWENPEVQEAMFDVLRFWLDRGVDGFRVDMVDFISKDPEFRDEDFEPTSTSDYLTQAKYQCNRPESIHHIRRMHDVIASYPNRVMIGEVPYHATLEQLRNFADPVNGAGMELPFNFRLTYAEMEAKSLKEFIDRYDASCGNDMWPNYNLSNHDRARTSRYGDLAGIAGMLILTLRGTPFIYYGDELNMPNVDVPPERQQDPWLVPETNRTRDECRTPMQWDANAFAGFSKTEPWLPLSPDFQKVNVEAQKSNPQSFLAMYRKLIALRKNTPALTVGSYESLSNIPESSLVYLREHEGEQVLIALNCSDEELIVPLPPKQSDWRVNVSTHMDRDETVANTVTLRPHEGAVLL